MSGWKVNNKMTGVKVAWFEDERNAEDWVGERSKPEYFQIVEQQDDSEFDRERDEQDRARIAAGEAQPMAAQGVEAWGVYLNQHPIYVNFSREPELGCGETVRRVRVVPVDDTKPEPAGSGFKETAENLNEQPAEDTALLDRIWDLAAGDTPEMKRPELGYEQAMYEIRKLFPKPAPAKPDLETVIRKTLEGFEPEGNASEDEVTEIAAAVRAHYEGTGE